MKSSIPKTRPTDIGVAIPGFLQTRPDDKTIAVCYIDGNFGTPHPPGLPDHNRIVVMVDGTDSALYEAGYHDTAGYSNIPLTRPAPATTDTASTTSG